MVATAERIDSRTAAAFAIGSATLFGASPPLAKLLLGQVEPLLLAGLLYLGSGMGFFTVGVGPFPAEDGPRGAAQTL
jgi:hypothetical protein